MTLTATKSSKHKATQVDMRFQPGDLVHTLARNVIPFAAVVSALLLLFHFVVAPGYYVTSGNLHDIFIPYNAALAVEQGLKLHSEFHSPFGWIYHQLNHGAWSLITKSHQLSVNDLMPLSSLIWALMVLTLLCAYVSMQSPNTLPSPAALSFVLLFIALTCFNFKGISSPSVRELTWYGTYNNHLWSLVFAQVFILFIHANRPSSRSSLLGQAFANALIVGLAVNYKITFGFTTLLIALLPAISCTSTQHRKIYLASFAMSAVVLIWWTVPEAYAYLDYIKDIQLAAAAKAEHAMAFKWSSLLFSTVSALALASLVSASETDWPWLPAKRHLAYSLVLMLAFHTSIEGDYAAPNVYKVVPLAMFWLIRRPTPPQPFQRVLAVGATGTIAACIAINLASDVRIAYYKNPKNLPKNHIHVDLQTPNGMLQWNIKKTARYLKMVEMFALHDNPHKAFAISQLAYRPSVNGADFSIPFENNDYVKSLTSSLEIIKDIGHRASLSSVRLDFTNPYPLLLGDPIPKGSMHWIHFGTSLPKNKKAEDIMFGVLGHTDMLIIPAATYGHDQALINCKFLRWNKAHSSEFLPVAVDDFGIYYKKGAKPDQAIGLDIDAATANCQELETDNLRD